MVNDTTRSMVHTDPTQTVLWAVCEHYGIPRAELTALRRDPFHVEARRVAATILADDVGLHPVAVGLAIGRERTTVLHHLSRIHKRQGGPAWTPEAREALADVRAALQRQGYLQRAG